MVAPSNYYLGRAQVQDNNGPIFSPNINIMVM